MDGVGSPDGLLARLAETEVGDISGRDQVPHRAGDLLDRHARVDAVLVQDVNAVGAEVAQAVVHDLADMLRATVEPEVTGVAELGGDQHLVAERCERCSDDLLVLAETVEFGCVEVGDAGVVGRPDGVSPVRFAAAAVSHGDPHRAIADSRAREPASAEGPRLHDGLLGGYLRGVSRRSGA